MKYLRLSALAVMAVFFTTCHSDENFSPRFGIDQEALDGTSFEDGDEENPFVLTTDENTSTFSIDADGGSYTNVRRYLEQSNQLPPAELIRTEEFINYFDLDYPAPAGEHPIALNGEVSSCPWNEEHQLVRIGIQGENIPEAELPNSNFVFLIDVSGSMSADDKLGLIKAGMHRFVDRMSPADFFSIVTYASRTEVHLASTSGAEESAIRQAIDRLESGGGTNGGAGIQLAYNEAAANFITGGNNRVILGTDGDFNVGITNYDDLISLIEEKRETGVFLTVLGVGESVYSQNTMEQIANKGNGTYEYLDKLAQLEKVFFHERAKFYTVAKDVKVQVEFDSNQVAAYRLIGYENRILNNEDFEDDEEDAGEIGAGQNITALYEIIPTGTAFTALPAFKIDFRYKLPDGDTSIPLTLDVRDDGNDFAASSEYQRFVTGVAGFSLLLLDSQYKGDLTYAGVRSILETVTLPDPHGHREELLELVELAEGL